MSAYQSVETTNVLGKDSLFQRKSTKRGTTYHETGHGEPLVLIHGVGMRLEAWAPQITHLSPSHRVIAVDMPGHGGSQKLPAGSRLEEYIDWFGEFLDEMELRSVNVAGHSMGAMISGGAAATFGGRIRRVAYLNGVHRRDPQAKAAVLARAQAIRQTGVDKDGPLARWFGDGADSNTARELTRHWLNLIDPEAYAIAYSAFATGDDAYADRWKDIVIPALFLTGSDDPNSTPSMARQMADLAPRGWARIIEGHRHMVNLTAPDVVNAMLAEWLSSIEGLR